MFEADQSVVKLASEIANSLNEDSNESAHKKPKIKVRGPAETEFYQQMCMTNARIAVFKHNFMKPQDFASKQEDMTLKVKKHSKKQTNAIRGTSTF